MPRKIPHLYTLLTERSRALVDQRPIYAVPGEKYGDIQMWALVARDPVTGAEAGLYEALEYRGEPFCPPVDFMHLSDAIRAANQLNTYAGRQIGHLRAEWVSESIHEDEEQDEDCINLLRWRHVMAENGRAVQ